MSISECRYVCVKHNQSFTVGTLYWLFPTDVTTLDENYAYVSNDGQLLTESYKTNYFIKANNLVNHSC
ncbi:hypothetical protein [Staphylococcus pseudoxylosus]|uniref:Uncharacterized protein n=1 Tax=Staphylococcus pseudoxylosus TaxID=2282419 RepID=A0AAQ0ME28_9STAP|nr:hypothetical protein [Staphylococcus pseudoxylosus]PTI80972.1 hypothetical protein BU098_12295 [Staphylococcus xylosus]MBM2659216.1 hypothetical protein [Staphylococcus pseudoxylosus]MCE5002375.1 hypothetical protein [Staphylococcus pseudoxylosus]MDW8545566.1 hypothetical protein [Staphylococcus pseudoxylosus]MEB5781920.1 hypothetical protein [Staphylococcus pseudoxylosus]